MLSILARQFYLPDTRKVAKALLGKIVVRETPAGTMTGKIVETEAYYGPSDPASHAFRGKTPRSRVMWSQGGTAYVYFTYGIHFLFNVVTEKKGRPGAVLIRALEPMAGIKLMEKNRHLSSTKNLTNGPAKLTQALGITLEDNYLDLTSRKSQLYLLAGENIPVREIVSATRIGISAGKDSKLRFYLLGNDFVTKNNHSKPRGFLRNKP